MALGREGEGPPPAGLRRGAIFELLFWLALAGSVWILTADFGAMPTDRPPAFDAAAWPRGIAVLMVVVAIGQFATGIRRSTPVVREDQESVPRSPKLIAAFLVPLAYAFLLPGTGFYASTPVFFVAMVMVLGERSLAKALLIPLAASALMILLFTGVLGLPLPVGTWPGFYETSSWLVEGLR